MFLSKQLFTLWQIYPATNVCYIRIFTQLTVYLKKLQKLVCMMSVFKYTSTDSYSYRFGMKITTKALQWFNKNITMTFYQPQLIPCAINHFIYKFISTPAISRHKSDSCNNNKKNNTFFNGHSHCFANVPARDVRWNTNFDTTFTF